MTALEAHQMTDLDRRDFLKGVLGSAAFGLLYPTANAQQAQAPAETVLWDASKAYRESTATRERIYVNGLWRWQPAGTADQTLPTAGWGQLRVPEAWPSGNHEGPDPQLYFPNPAWQKPPAGGVTAAWYEREITVPAEWAGRRVTLDAGYVNSYAVIYLDGAKVGEIRFPSGEIDLTGICRPGRKQLLTIFVVALPLKAVMMSFSDSAAARQVAGSVERRGLCGDIYLASTPAAARITGARVETSVRNWEIAFDLALADLDPNRSYSLRAQVTDGGKLVKDFTSQPIQLNELSDGRIRVTENWRPENLWDTHTPQNQYDVSLSLARFCVGKNLGYSVAGPLRL
jgi:beta-galactosidase